MVEDTTRGEQLFKQAKGGGSSSDGGGSFNEKLAKMFLNIRNLFVNLGTKKPPQEVKKAPVPVSAAFSTQGLDLKSVNRVLVFILTGLIAATVYVTFRQRPDVSSVASAVSKIKFQDLEGRAITAFQQADFYLKQVRTRNIFSKFKEAKPPVKEVKPVEEAPPPPPKVTIQEKAKDLKLMGISLGSTPKAIIRNEKIQDIYFLREGDKIKGTDISVKKILRDEVIIGSDGDEMTML